MAGGHFGCRAALRICTKQVAALLAVLALAGEAPRAAALAIACWGSSGYGGSCPSEVASLGSSSTEVMTNFYGAVVAVDRAANRAVCWGSVDSGGECPTGENWTGVELFRTAGAFLAIDRAANSAFCWGHSNYGANCPAGVLPWSGVEVYSSGGAFVAIHRASDTAFCWGSADLGGSCPTGKSWRNVEIFSTNSAFLAIDRATNEAFCWGDASNGGTCPVGKSWSNVNIVSTSASFVAVDPIANDAFCWGAGISSCPSGQSWSNVEISSTWYGAFVAVDRLANTAFCWGSAGSGGTCPEGEDWRNVRVFSTGDAFVAVDSQADRAFCWGAQSAGGACPTGKSWSNVEVFPATSPGTGTAFIAIDRAANDAFCWGHQSYGGTCPTTATWDDVVVLGTYGAFIAVPSSAVAGRVTSTTKTVTTTRTTTTRTSSSTTTTTTTVAVLEEITTTGVNELGVDIASGTTITAEDAQPSTASCSTGSDAAPLLGLAVIGSIVIEASPSAEVVADQDVAGGMCDTIGTWMPVSGQMEVALGIERRLAQLQRAANNYASRRLQGAALVLTYASHVTDMQGLTLGSLLTELTNTSLSEMTQQINQHMPQGRGYTLTVTGMSTPILEYSGSFNASALGLQSSVVGGDSSFGGEGGLVPSSLASGTRVRVRNAESESWQLGTVVSLNPLRVVLDGSLSPVEFAIVERKPFVIGDQVRVRNGPSEPWQLGIVASASPLLVMTDGASTAAEFAVVEITQFLSGDRVRVRNQASESWQLGTVTSLVPLQVVVDGSELPLEFVIVERVEFLTGDRVQVRNQPSEPWQIGTVASLLPLQVLVDGSASPAEFAIVEEAPAGQLLSGDRVQVRNQPSDNWQLGTVISVLPLEVVPDGAVLPSEFVIVQRLPLLIGDRVRVRNQPSDAWQLGTVVSVHPLRVLLDGAESPAEFEIVKKIAGASSVGGTTTLPAGLFLTANGPGVDSAGPFTAAGFRAMGRGGWWRQRATVVFWLFFLVHTSVAVATWARGRLHDRQVAWVKGMRQHHKLCAQGPSLGVSVTSFASAVQGSRTHQKLGDSTPIRKRCVYSPHQECPFAQKPRAGVETVPSWQELKAAVASSKVQPGWRSNIVVPALLFILIRLLGLEINPDEFLAERSTLWEITCSGLLTKGMQMSVAATLGFSGMRPFFVAEWNIPGTVTDFCPKLLPGLDQHGRTTAPPATFLELGPLFVSGLGRSRSRLLLADGRQACLAELWCFFKAVHPIIPLVLYRSSSSWLSRVLAHLCSSLGAFAFAALLLVGSGGRAAREGQPCAAEDIWPKTGQDLGIALAAMVLAAIPASLLTLRGPQGAGACRPAPTNGLHEGAFSKSAMVPLVGLTGVAGFFLITLAFLANACPSVADHWLLILCMQVAISWIFHPAALTVGWGAFTYWAAARRPGSVEAAALELEAAIQSHGISSCTALPTTSPLARCCQAADVEEGSWMTVESCWGPRSPGKLAALGVVDRSRSEISTPTALDCDRSQRSEGSICVVCSPAREHSAHVDSEVQETEEWKEATNETIPLRRLRELSPRMQGECVAGPSPTDAETSKPVASAEELLVEEVTCQADAAASSLRDLASADL